MSLQSTPNGQRLHIAIFGRRNAGKSTLLNMLCDQDVSLVSHVAGTTTDPVHKAMEIPSLGPVLFYDTAGLDDEGYLGIKRVEKTKSIISKIDLAIVLFHDITIDEELVWIQELKHKHIPIIYVYNQHANQSLDIYQQIQPICKEEMLCVDAKDIMHRKRLLQAITRALPSDVQTPSIIGHLVKEKDVILLVMPQDEQAPKGRLILPQVQTIRDLLDLKCIIQCCTPSTLDQALSSLQQPPTLIITDSQVFQEVFQKKPKESLLTSFSVLFARYKGDVDYFVQGAKAMACLHETSRILIAEACTHAPLSEDIGRVKLPRLLRKRYGEGLQIDIVNGMDFPSDVRKYDLVIHCGACMFHRTYVLSRVEQVRAQHVAMSNYGIVLAYLQGILECIEI